MGAVLFLIFRAFFQSSVLSLKEFHMTPASPAPGKPTRRDFIRKAGAPGGAATFGIGNPGAWAAGSHPPEKKEVKIGFIPLTDCASVVMASVLGIDKKYGVTIIPTKEAS